MDQIHLRNLKNRLKAAQANLEQKRTYVAEGKGPDMSLHRADIECVGLEFYIEDLIKEIEEMEA